MQKVDADSGNKKSTKYRIAKFIWNATGVMILTFIIWPNSFYYMVMQVFPAGTNNPYRAASAIGENGSLFFIKIGLNSSDPTIRSLMVYPSMHSYLERHGGTEDIWRVIVRVLKDSDALAKMEQVDVTCLEGFVYGKTVPVPGEKKAERVLYFPVEKVQWANEHIFKRPRNYQIPEELLPNTANE